MPGTDRSRSNDFHGLIWQCEVGLGFHAACSGESLSGIGADRIKHPLMQSRKTGASAGAGPGQGPCDRSAIESKPDMKCTMRAFPPLTQSGQFQIGLARKFLRALVAHHHRNKPAGLIAGDGRAIALMCITRENMVARSLRVVDVESMSQKRSPTMRMRFRFQILPQ